jgi:sodium/hydrogen antiporter
MVLVTIFISAIFLYALISRRLEETVITGPMIFTIMGIMTLIAIPGLEELEDNRRFFLPLAEMGLVMTLFSDATTVQLRLVTGNVNIPLRLLSSGMLLTIILGAGLALTLFHHLSVWEAGILAAILAPTDAGLGQIIVNSRKVPLLIRQSLNVEAGLNDGLSVPFMLFFIALAVSGTEGAGAVITRFIIEQLVLGSVVGLLIGLIGGWLLGLAYRKKWSAEMFQQLALVALPIFCVIASKPTGSSMFIAAFVAGMAVQAAFRDLKKISVGFTEECGQILNLFVFFLFGLFVARAWKEFDSISIIYAVLSLTIIRMIPVAIALRGTGLDRASVLFMGWFGPRGLASIVLGLVYLEEEALLPSESSIRLVVMMTVLLSIFAHGLSAFPGIRLYSRLLKLTSTTKSLSSNCTDTSLNE